MNYLNGSQYIPAFICCHVTKNIPISDLIHFVILIYNIYANLSFYCNFYPVEPNPPSPLVVCESSFTNSKFIGLPSMDTNWNNL